MIQFFRRIHKDKVEKSINNITDYIGQLEEDNQRLQDKISNFNKDSEIQKHKDEVMKVRENSLMQLSPKESVSIRDFRLKHFKSCGNSGDFEYRLISTGIGTDITIKCPICMAAENVTDNGDW